MSTLREIERILRAARHPISLNEIKRRMSAKAVRHETVRMVVDEFVRQGFVIRGRAGVVWAFDPVPQSGRRGPRRGVPDIEDLVGSLSEFGPVEAWKEELDKMRGEEE